MRAQNSQGVYFRGLIEKCSANQGQRRAVALWMFHGMDTRCYTSPKKCVFIANVSFLSCEKPFNRPDLNILNDAQVLNSEFGKY